MQLYALEGFLTRLAESPYRYNFVLQGGVLLAAYDLRRPTRDIDLQAEGLHNDEHIVKTAVTEIASRRAADGLTFVTSDVGAAVIRDEDEYPGVRVTLPAELATARLKLQVDINIGDPVWPTPLDVEVPRLLDDVDISVRGYPLHMVHAEKIVTACQRGTVNTRWRDFADIYLLSCEHPVDGDLLQAALRMVARYRSVEALPLRKTLKDYADIAKDHWSRWRNRQQLDPRLPEGFADVLSRVYDFADPAIVGAVSNCEWNPIERAGFPIRFECPLRHGDLARNGDP